MLYKVNQTGHLSFEISHNDLSRISNVEKKNIMEAVEEFNLNGLKYIENPTFSMNDKKTVLNIESDISVEATFYPPIPAGYDDPGEEETLDDAFEDIADLYNSLYESVKGIKDRNGNDNVFIPILHSGSFIKNSESIIKEMLDSYYEDIAKEDEYIESLMENEDEIDR